MSTQAAPVHEDLDALEQNAAALIGEQANSPHFLPAMGLKAMRVVKIVPTLTAELRLLRELAGEAYETLIASGYCDFCEANIFVDNGVETVELDHKRGCQLDAYRAWREKQGREESSA